MRKRLPCLLLALTLAVFSTACSNTTATNDASQQEESTPQVSSDTIEEDSTEAEEAAEATEAEETESAAATEEPAADETTEATKPEVAAKAAEAPAEEAPAAPVDNLPVVSQAAEVIEEVTTPEPTIAETPMTEPEPVVVEEPAPVIEEPVQAEPVIGPPYYITVDRAANVCNVYCQDANGQFTVLVRSMVCSTGRPGHETPTGTFSIYEHTTSGYHLMVDGTYGRYCMRFRSGGYMFHSVCYWSAGATEPIPEEVAALGTSVSAGCVRLSVADAEWMYNNMSNGTTVQVF